MNLREISKSSFENLLTEFLQFLEKEKLYKPLTLKNYYLKLYKIPLFMHTHGLESYSPDVGLRYYHTYIAEHPDTISQQKNILTSVRRLNAFISKEEYVIQYKLPIKLLPQNFEQAVNLFEAKCYKSGNKEITIKKKVTFVRQFLKYCIVLGCSNMQELNPSYVMKVCLKIKNKDSWAVIRAFLKLMNIIGITENDLSTLVPYFKQSFKIPDTYSKVEISKIEHSIDRLTDIGKRDYAMILLASRIGLRSCDIVNLNFSNLDFDNNKLSIIQQKTHEALELPMIPELKQALEEYICNGRPQTTERRIFIRHNAPYQRITTSVLRFVISKYFIEAGVDRTGKKHGPQTFRSSLASSMVNDSIPYNVIRKILGHSDPNAIKHYAKLDIEILRLCAIEVPKPSEKFKEFLDGGWFL